MEKFLDQEFLEYLVKSLVDHPEAVEVTRTVDNLGVLLRLKVHKDDMGQIVGRLGATAKAIRSLLRIVGIKHQARVNLKIEEPEGSTFVRPEPAQRPQVAAPIQAAPVADLGPSAASEYKPSAPAKFDGPIADELKF